MGCFDDGGYCEGAEYAEWVVSWWFNIINVFSKTEADRIAMSALALFWTCRTRKNVRIANMGSVVDDGEF